MFSQTCKTGFRVFGERRMSLPGLSTLINQPALSRAIILTMSRVLVSVPHGPAQCVQMEKDGSNENQSPIIKCKMLQLSSLEGMRPPRTGRQTSTRGIYPVWHWERVCLTVSWTLSFSYVSVTPKLKCCPTYVTAQEQNVLRAFLLKSSKPSRHQITQERSHFDAIREKEESH